jgi:zinc/manganese transport system substrate-binding protein
MENKKVRRRKMKKIFIVALLFLVNLLFLPSDSEIVVTLPVIKFVVDKITQTPTLCSAILKEDTDPHFYEAKLSYILMLKKAKLLILADSHLEVYVEALLSAANNPAILKGGKGYLELSTVVDKIETPSTGDRAQGDFHPTGNPHFYIDPQRIRKIAQAIFTKLIEIYPGNEKVYKENYEAFLQELDSLVFGAELVKEVKPELLYKLWKTDKVTEYLKEKNLIEKWEGVTRKLYEIKDEKVLAYHKSFTYILGFSKLNEFDVVEPKPGIPPSTSRLLELVKKVENEKIKGILIEPFYPLKHANFIKEKAGNSVCVLVVSTNRYNYFEWLRDYTERSYKALKEGKCE